jgi:hypothetical protein
MRRVVAACLLAAAVWIAPTASADSQRGLVITYQDEQDGRGWLVAYPTPDGAWGRMSWEACAPAGGCEAVQPDATTDRSLHVGDAAPGTIFKATASDGEESVSGSSDPYGGRLQTVVKPSVQGALRVGHLIKPVAGRWSGGWGGEVPLLQLQVCRKRRGGPCKVISDNPYWDPCPDTGARLPRRYLGWFVKVADVRYARIPIFADRLYTSPEALTPFTPDGRTAVASVGRIRPGRGPAGPC